MSGDTDGTLQHAGLCCKLSSSSTAFGIHSVSESVQKQIFWFFQWNNLWHHFSDFLILFPLKNFTVVLSKEVTCYTVKSVCKKLIVFRYSLTNVREKVLQIKQHEGGESDALYAGNIQELYWQELIFIPADVIRGNLKYTCKSKLASGASWPYSVSVRNYLKI